MKAPLLLQTGKQAGEIELNDAVFQAPVNKRLIELVTIAFAGNQRRGTADTKERKEVRGGGKKPWKQKGTGRARHSSRRSPIWRGGGTVFGPHPRDYDTNLPEGMKRTALISVLSLKNKENNIAFLDSLTIKEAKTKELVAIIKTLGLDGTRTVFVVSGVDEKLKRAANNLKELFQIKLARDVNAYHLMRRTKVLIAKEAVSVLEQRALGESAQLETSGAAK